MSKDKGWIKVHRSIMEKWVYDNPWALKAFMHLCMTVNIKAKKTSFDGRHYTIQPGQRITSETTLAHELKFTWRTVKKILQQFEEEDMIRIDRIGKAFIVTVLNFRTYQGLLASSDESSDESSDASSKPSSDASRQLKKGKNNLKNEIKKGKEGAQRPFNPWEGDPE